MPRADAITPGYDLSSLPAAPPGASTPKEGVKSKRKQTLLSLLDALQELSKDGELDITNNGQQPSFEDDRDVPTVDEHLQKVGAEAFNRFERRIINLDKELRNFANAARQLGSSVGILSSSFHLRERLAQILFLFRENAADLFPRKVHRQPREGVMNPNVRPRRKAKSVHIANPAVLDDLDAEDFPDQLQGLAEDVIIFLDCLNEFPEFTDEGVNTSITSLEGDLKYWASCLRAYETQFKYPAVQRYLHDLTSEMGEHLDSITSSLQIFIEIGVPTIRFAQKHAAANLLNLSTVATFFSAVTATTMQFSFDQVDGPLQNSVNGFWFTSLVFSIGAAVNSLLGLTWKQAMYRSPGHRVPWWVLIWIKRSPLVFLVLSVACFSMGLVLFAYSSGQHRITSTVTTVFSACSCFGLAAVSCWFASERIIFTKHKGEKWLADVLSETKVQMHRLPGIGWILTEPGNVAHKVAFWTRRRGHDVGDYLKMAGNFVFGWTQRFRRHPDDLESADGSERKSPMSHHSFSPEPTSPRSHRPSDATAAILTPISEHAPSTVDGHDDPTVVNDNGTAPLSSPPPVNPARTRFTNIVRSVMMMRSAAGSTATPTPSRKRTLSADNGKPAEPPGMVRKSRVARLIPRLKQMEMWLDLSPHQALVRHLQFSPNGRYLATSSWDRTSVIFKIGEDLSATDFVTAHRTLAHPQGFVGQVAWSPNGQQLLTKMNRGIKVWTEDGVCKRTIDRGHNVQSITWLPTGDAFLSVEGSYVVKLDTNGKILAEYKLERMILHDVAVTPNCQRLLCVGTLTASSDGLQPKRSRAEKQIIVLNLEHGIAENRVPVLHEVRDITMARVGDVALVSYENKAPPQLWKLDYIKDSARLSLRHTYMPKVTVDFAGPSYFGGKDDELVLCAGKAGDIHIWDRESATLLHHIRPQALGGGDLTCIAWNPSADPFMFATGTHDGGVHLWTIPPDGLRLFDDAPSRGSTHPTPTPRTASPNIFDGEHRVDSPSSSGNESQDGLLSPHSAVSYRGANSREREPRVAFQLTNPP